MKMLVLILKIICLKVVKIYIDGEWMSKYQIESYLDLKRLREEVNKLEKDSNGDKGVQNG